MLKKILIAFVALFTTLSASAAFELGEYSRNEKTLGARVGYTGLNRSMIMGIDGTWAPVPMLRLAANMDYAFKNHGVSALALDVNAHVPMHFTEASRLTFYPMAGLDVTQVIDHGVHLGLNLGFGTEYRVASDIGLFGEVKGVIKSGTYGAFAAGLRFRF